MNVLLTIIVAGLLGGAAMLGVMGLMTRAGLARANMVLALGSLFTRARHGAYRVGITLHLISAIVFAAFYAAVLFNLNMTTLPLALLLGAAIGFVHGLAVSLMLVWVIAERHPLEEFQEADLAIGLSHLAGHVVFGGVVGLVIGLMT